MDFTEEQLRKLIKQPIHISKVFVNGVGRTKDDFVKDISSLFFTAQTFGEFLARAQQVQGNFNGLGVTKGVKITLDTNDDDKDGSLIVSMDLIEKSRFAGGVRSFLGNDSEVKVGVGGGMNVNGLFPNILGRAEKLSCCWQQSIHSSRRELVFTKPLSSRFTSFAGCSLFNYSGHVTLSGYKENNTGLSVDLNVPSGDFHHKVSWLGVWRQLHAINNKTCFAVREEAGHSLKSSVKYEMSYDDRDDMILPSEGKLFRLSQELAGLGGDTSFYSKQLSLQINKRLFNTDRVVLQLGANAGHVQPLNLFKSRFQSKPLSILDKFYLGGPTSLRGFENKGIGPRQQDNALGSDFYWQLSATLRLPLPGVRGGLLDLFRPQLFVNCGNSINWSSASSMEERLHQHIDTLRLSYGAGIVTNFLGARLELNYCIPVRHQLQDQVKHGFQIGISLGD